jgi:lysozyme
LSKKGIDVSKHQGSINWPLVKQNDIEFAMIRVGYGSSSGDSCVLDPRFMENVNGALGVGIEVGIYLYSYAKSPEAARKEAQFVLKNITPYSGKLAYPIVFDIEDKSQKKLGKAVITDMVKAFCETIENAGYYTSLYTYLDFLRNYLDINALKKYDLWLAHWTDNPSKAYEYGMWQYTSKGSVQGINGRVDMNVAYKNYPEIICSAGLNGYVVLDDIEKENGKLKAEIRELKESLEYEQRENERLGGIIQRVRDVVA